MPLAPESMVIHDAPVVAVQVQPLVLVTAIVLAPPLAVGDADVGDTPKVQAGAAAWVIVTACPATVSVAVREEVVVLAATV